MDRGSKIAQNSVHVICTLSHMPSLPQSGKIFFYFTFIFFRINGLLFDSKDFIQVVWLDKMGYYALLKVISRQETYSPTLLPYSYPIPLLSLKFLDFVSFNAVSMQYFNEKKGWVKTFTFFFKF